MPDSASTTNAAPTGTVTFLFTDIEGSTRLLERLHGAYADVLAEHRRILRDAFARWNGHEVDTQGDSFFVAFSRASDALRARSMPNAPLSNAPSGPTAPMFAYGWASTRANRSSQVPITWAWRFIARRG